MNAPERMENTPPQQNAVEYPVLGSHQASGPPPDSYSARKSSFTDGRRFREPVGTQIKAEEDIPDSHELFLLGEGEKKIEVIPITEVANATLFKFNKEDHTLANLLRDKLCRVDHVTFAAYKVPHPLFATFELRVHTDGEITPKEAVLQACQELVQELQILDQEFTKEFELRKITGQGPNAGLDL